MLTLIERSDGRVRIARNFWRHVDLTPDELRLVAQHADLPHEWPEGFIEQLRTACGALLMFREKLADSGPPASILSGADKLLEVFGALVRDSGIYRPEESHEEQATN